MKSPEQPLSIRHHRHLAPVAESLGIVMATEAHMDYRCADYLAVMQAVDSPWLRHCFDFANPITVIEDPLDAVARLEDLADAGISSRA